MNQAALSVVDSLTQSGDFDGFDGVEAGTILSAGIAADNPLNRRSQFRKPVEVSRPIAICQQNHNHTLAKEWVQADILDLSTGGLCLLITGDPEFEPSTRLLLDLSAQPGFGLGHLSTTLRWFVKSDLVVTLGVGFDDLLEQVPQLI